MESARFELVVVAFMRSVGGRVRVLLAVDRDGEQLFDGEPALLAEHRPGRPARELEVEGADRIDPRALAHVREHACVALAELIEQAFDDAGAFEGQRILGRGTSVMGARSMFDA